MAKRRSGNQGNRISGKRIEDRRRKTDTGEYRILNKEYRMMKEERGWRTGIYGFIPAAFCKGGKKPKDSAILEPL
ncbi:MAG: hypothetical protein ABIL62_10745 [Planctomycetota bacterium]